MDREWIVRDEAKQFISNIGAYEYQNNGHEKLKQELEYKLLDFDEPSDRLIFLYEILKYLEIELDKHMESCKYKNDPESCGSNKFYWKSIFFTEQEVRGLNPSHSFKIFRPLIQADLVKENLIGLANFPDTGKLYQSALDKINERRFERNLLDDLRLALELLMKSILTNGKSLENQADSLGAYLKEKGASKECSNMFIKLVDYFAKYQNNYIKHNDKVNQNEIDLITNLCSSFMSYLMNL